MAKCQVFGWSFTKTAIILYEQFFPKRFKRIGFANLKKNTIKCWPLWFLRNSRRCGFYVSLIFFLGSNCHFYCCDEMMWRIIDDVDFIVLMSVFETLLCICFKLDCQPLQKMGNWRAKASASALIPGPWHACGTFVSLEFYRTYLFVPMYWMKSP